MWLGPLALDRARQSRVPETRPGDVPLWLANDTVRLLFGRDAPEEDEDLATTRFLPAR